MRGSANSPTRTSDADDGDPHAAIGRERRTNPALQLDPEQFIDYQIANTPPLPQDFLKIKAANKS